jgi:hypothetical protein
VQRVVALAERCRPDGDGTLTEEEVLGNGRVRSRERGREGEGRRAGRRDAFLRLLVEDSELHDETSRVCLIRANFVHCVQPVPLGTTSVWMHRHRQVWPIVQRSCSRSRSAATAVRPKVHQHPDAEPSPSPVAPGKWALPRQTPASLPQQNTRSSRSFPSQPPSAGGQNKWSRPRPSTWDSSGTNQSRQFPSSTPSDRSTSNASRFSRDNVRERSNTPQQRTPSRGPADPSSHQRVTQRSEWKHPRADPSSSDRQVGERSDHRNARSAKSNRNPHKERGSLLSRFSEEEAQKTQQTSQRPVKVKKAKVIEKKVLADVYIPSVVSVGTLARLLGVRLGKDLLLLQVIHVC